MREIRLNVPSFGLDLSKCGGVLSTFNSRAAVLSVLPVEEDQLHWLDFCFRAGVWRVCRPSKP